MKIKNIRSSVSYSLVSYKEDGTVESEINYKVRKSDDKIIMSWIEFVDESAKIGDVYVLRDPTPILEDGVLTYDIAYAKRKFIVKVKYYDNKLSKAGNDTEFVEQLAADLFEESIRRLANDPVHIPGLVESQKEGISMSIKIQKD